MISTKGLRDEQDPDKLHARGAIRRMVVSLTTKAIWQLAGFILGGGKRETMNAEPFGGIGFFARPPASGKPEAIVLMVGDDSRQPVVVAVRDEKTRQAIAGALAENETAMFNDAATVVIKSDGTIEARSKNGAAVPLVTFAEFMRHGHTCAAAGNPSTAPIPVVDPGDPLSGTDVLKGE